MKKTVVYVITLFLSVNGICFAGNTKKEDKTMKNQKIVQTAGRDSLGRFAPEFAHFNDDRILNEWSIFTIFSYILSVTETDSFFISKHPIKIRSYY